MKTTIQQAVPLFLRLNEVTLKSADGDDVEVTPMIVSVTMIAQIFRRSEMARPKGHIPVIGEKKPPVATAIRLTTGLSFHVEETPDQVFEMIQQAISNKAETDPA